MEHWQLYDYVRLGTAFLALISMYRSAYRAHKLWRSYTQRLKELHWAMQGLLFLLLEGSLEAIVLDAPGGPRTFISFFVVAGATRAIFRNEGFIEYEDTPTPKKGQST